MPEPDITNPDGGGQNAPVAEAKQPVADTTASSKIKFTTEQQDVVNDLIDRMYGKGFEKAKTLIEKEWEAKLADVKAENEKLAKQLAAQKAPPQPKADEAAKPKADEAKPAERGIEVSPDIQQLMARFDEMQTVASSLKAERDTLAQRLQEETNRSRKTLIKEAFITASKDISFFDPMEVFELIQKQIDVDEGDQIIIKNPRTGQPRLNGNMEPMTLTEFLAEFATTKPYMVRASARDGGTGAGGSRRVEAQSSSKGPDFRAMTNEEFEAYRNRILSGQG